MGYATGQFGKNHLGDLNEFLPTVHGFDEFFGYLYHLDAMEDPAHRNYPQDLKDTVGPRNMVHCWATDTDDPTVQPRWGKIGKQRIEDAGTLYPEADGDRRRRDPRRTRSSSSTRRRRTASRSSSGSTRPGCTSSRTSPTSTRRCATSENGWSIQEAGMAQLDDIVGSVMKKLEDNGPRRQHDRRLHAPTTAPRTSPGPTAARRRSPAARAPRSKAASACPAIVRWPGKVPAGKVENGIISGLDWFPTLVAAAGNPNIVDELKQGKTIGDRTYKVHLDGYDQTRPDHRQGPVEAPRDLLLRRGHPRRGADRRLQVPLHRPAERLARRHGQGRLADPRQPAPRPVRAHRDARRQVGSLAFYNWFAYEFWRFVFVQQEVGKVGADASSSSRRCRRARASTWRP